MPADWISFSSQLSQFLIGKQSSGPNETGQKIADLYLQALRTSQTPFGNFFNTVPGSEPLKIAFSALFQELSKSESPTPDEKKEDPSFDPAPEEPIPSGENASEEFEKEFQQYLRDSKIQKFKNFELVPEPSEYVLEIDPAKRDEVLEKRNTNERRRSERIKQYESELKLYEELKRDYVENQLSADSKTQSQQKDQPDAYDKLALAIVAFWATSGPIVFSSVPPIPPATEPLPGTFLVIYPGNPITLADGLRRAFNLGLNEKFKDDPTGSLSASAISSALSLVFAKHLLSLKFIYNGTLTGVPVVSIVPLIF